MALARESRSRVRWGPVPVNARRRKRGSLVTRTLISLAILCTLGAVLSGCSSSYRQQAPAASPAKGYGPPPHAPAHGYRHKQSTEVELVYDSRTQVYVVVGASNHYFSDGFYFRYTGGYWEIAASLGGAWTRVAVDRIPEGLRPKKSKRKHDRH